MTTEPEETELEEQPSQVQRKYGFVIIAAGVALVAIGVIKGVMGTQAEKKTPLAGEQTQPSAAPKRVFELSGQSFEQSYKQAEAAQRREAGSNEAMPATQSAPEISKEERERLQAIQELMWESMSLTGGERRVSMPASQSAPAPTSDPLTLDPEKARMAAIQKTIREREQRREALRKKRDEYLKQQEANSQ